MVKKVVIPYSPRPWQAHAHANMVRFTVMVVHRRAGKALDLNTDIPMASGEFKKLRDIQDGDMIIDNFGKPTKVMKAHEVIKDAESYEVIFQNGDKVIACKDHQWYVEPSHSKVRNLKPWKSGEVVNTEVLKNLINEESYFIPCTEAVEYKHKQLPVDPYMLGLWLGDGASDDFIIYGVDEEIHEYAKNLKTSNGWQREYGGVTRTRAGGSTILKHMNLINNKHIPQQYKFSSIKQRRELVRGLMDSDGSSEIRRTSSRFSNNNLRLCRDLKEVLSSLGVRCSITKESRAEHYTIKFSSSFNPFKLDRKAKRWAPRSVRASRNKIVAINRVEDRDMRCLTVDSDMSLFLATKNYIPTHNTIFAVNELLKRVTTVERKRPQVAYIAPTRVQAKQIAWEELKSLVKNIPGTKINESELRVDLPNKGRIMVLGAENPDALRGLYLDYAVLDEVADMPKTVWSTVLRPALADREGGALFIGTPKGKNYFHDLYMQGMTAPNWKSILLSYHDTNALNDIEVEALRTEMSEEEFSQELECSFTAAIRGSYYGKQIERAERENRIGKVPYDPSSPVYTAWDIGFDGTSIWYAQVINNEFRVIDYDEFVDKDIPYCVNIVLGKSYIYEYHILPHDAKKRSITDKSKTVIGHLEKLGLKCKVASKLPILDGITAGRNLIDKCFIDFNKCQRGLESLRHYRAQYDESKGVLQQTPIHDEYSHGADAFRYLAVGLKPRSRRPSYGIVNRGGYDPFNRNFEVKNDWDVFR